MVTQTESNEMVEVGFGRTCFGFWFKGLSVGILRMSDPGFSIDGTGVVNGLVLHL